MLFNRQGVLPSSGWGEVWSISTTGGIILHLRPSRKPLKIRLDMFPTCQGVEVRRVVKQRKISTPKSTHLKNIAQLVRSSIFIWAVANPGHIIQHRKKSIDRGKAGGRPTFPRRGQRRSEVKWSDRPLRDVEADREGRRLRGKRRGHLRTECCHYTCEMTRKFRTKLPVR